MSQELFLAQGQGLDVAGAAQQGDVGVAAQRARGGAGGIEENSVSQDLRFPSQNIGGDDLGGELCAVQIGSDAGQARLVAVHSGDGGAGGGKLHRFATRGGAKIEDGLARNLSHQLCGKARGGILHPPVAFSKTSKAREVGAGIEAACAKGAWAGFGG